MAAQRATEVSPTVRLPPADRSTVASLRTDLAIAREELRVAADEAKRLRARLRHELGRELEQSPASDLRARVRELELLNTQAIREHEETKSSLDDARERVAVLERELAGKNDAIGKLMRQVNSLL